MEHQVYVIFQWVRNLYKSLLYQNNVGLTIQAETTNTNIYFIVNDGTSNLQPLRVNPLGVIHVGGNVANKNYYLYGIKEIH